MCKIISLNNFKVSIYPCSGGTCILHYPTEGEAATILFISIYVYWNITYHMAGGWLDPMT